ncbi:MAG: hypothetical protein E7430_03460 [Ruminococcaceae bacterium]|nr:hypothetical protein [Oscillospiraceae bacterium]
MKKRLPALVLALSMIFTLASGCDKSKPAEEVPESPAIESEQVVQPSPEQSPQLPPEPYDENGNLRVPFVETQQISMWDVLEDGAEPLSTAVDAEIGRLLNISLSYCYATESSAKEQFGVMEAAGEYYDLMLDVDKYYSGGADAAIDDGVIMDLQGLSKLVPNLETALYENDESFKLTESGRLFQLPIIVTGSVDPDAMGLTTRRDGLEYLEITSPETYDEFFFLLQMLKNICGAKRGYLLPDSGFSEGLAYGFGAYNGFYQVDNVVKYGFLEQSYKDYMDYVYVLLDNRLAIFEQAGSGYNLKGRVNSSWVTTWYGGVDEWDQAAEVLEDDQIAAIGWPVPNRGDTVHFIESETTETKGVSVSAAAGQTKAEVIFALANYLYSDEFTAISNCGIEGETFSYDADGGVVLSDSIMLAEDPKAALREVSLMMNLPRFVDNTYLANAYTPGQQEALSVWREGTDGAYLLPELEISAEDQEYIDTVMADVTALADQFLPGYIQGDFDAYDYEDTIAEMTELGIRQVIDIYQIALTGEVVPYEEPEETLSDKLVPTYSSSGSSPAPVVSTAPETEEPAEETPAEGESAEPPAEGDPAPELSEPENPVDEPSDQPPAEETPEAPPEISETPVEPEADTPSEPPAEESQPAQEEENFEIILEF